MEKIYVHTDICEIKFTIKILYSQVFIIPNNKYIIRWLMSGPQVWISFFPIFLFKKIRRNDTERIGDENFIQW